MFIIGVGSPTKDIARFIDKQPTFFYLGQKSDKGIGRARNVAIPLLEGKYVWFSDPNDTHYLQSMWEAVDQALRLDVDLMFMPFKTTTETSGKPKVVEIPEEQLALWKQPKQTLEEQKRVAYGLQSHAFDRLVRTELVLDGDISFGPTPKHSELQFHWDAITQARTIAFFKGRPVCVHKISAQPRGIAEEKMFVNAVELTQRVLTRRGFFSNGATGAATPKPQNPTQSKFEILNDKLKPKRIFLIFLI